MINQTSSWASWRDCGWLSKDILVHSWVWKQALDIKSCLGDGLLIDQKLEKADTSKFWQLLMNDCIDSCSPLSRLPLWVVGGTLCLPARLGAYFTVLGSMSCHMWHMFCTHNQYMFYTILTHFAPGIRISTQNLHSFNNERAIKQSLYVFRIFSCFKILISMGWGY